MTPVSLSKKALSVLLSVTLVASSVPQQATYAFADELAGPAITEVEEIAPSIVIDGEAQDALPSVELEDTSAPDTNGEVTLEGSESGAETSPEPQAAPEDTDQAPQDAQDSADSSAEYLNTNGVEYAQVSGLAATTHTLAVTSLMDLTGIDWSTADAAADDILLTSLAGELEGEGSVDIEHDRRTGLPTNADGSDIKEISAKWVTIDSDRAPTDPDSDPANLYLRPQGDGSQSVHLRITYAFSGENDYEPGAITITFPASVFRTRDGAKADTFESSIPKEPSIRGTWSYKIVDGEVVITNIKGVSAATSGFMDFRFNGITPHLIEDRAVTEPFEAHVELITHLNNTIANTSNALTAEMDTQASIEGATKRVGNVKLRRTEDLTTQQKEALEAYGHGDLLRPVEEGGQEGFAVVTWYMNPQANLNNNQPFTLDIHDALGGVTMLENANDQTGTPVAPLSGKQHVGWITSTSSGTISADGQSVSGVVFENSYRPGTLTSSTTTVVSVYPLGEFAELNKHYVFDNDVDYSITEQDGENLTDADEESQNASTRWKTSASDSARERYYYRGPVFELPSGFFYNYKSGNSNKPYGGNTYESLSYNGSSYGDLASGRNGYWGKYSRGINDLVDGKDVEVSYTISNVAYLLPYTYDGPTVWNPETQTDPRQDVNNYGKKELTVTSTEKGLESQGYQLREGTDYEYVWVQFPQRPSVQKAREINLRDGEFTSYDDGSIRFETDNDPDHTPKITLRAKFEGSDEWVNIATASWQGNGNLSFENLHTSIAVDGDRIMLPKEVEQIGTTYTSSAAGITNYMRIGTNLLASGSLASLAANELEHSNNPWLYVTNSAGMEVTRGNEFIWGGTATADDRLAGFKNETRVELTKSGGQSRVDVDQGIVYLNYSASLKFKSYVSDRELYEDVVSSGALTSLHAGTWYDLLPAGVTPDLSTIRLRNADSVRRAYTIENYKGTGRTLMVVEVNLTPVPSRYDDMYYMDNPTISFGATLPMESIFDYGTNVHNVIAFESDVDQLGTVKGYVGEKDDPLGTNHRNTSQAWANDQRIADVERMAMTDLNPNRDTPSFVYAGVDGTLDLLSAAEVSLDKKVMVNNDGRWSSGVYNGQKELEQRNVYVGGNYSYRLSMVVAPGSQAEEIVIFDTLENYHAVQGNDDIDIDAPRWKGSFVGVDTSVLVNRGVDPVVYYSTVPNLKLSNDEPGSNRAYKFEDNVNLSNTAVWSTTPPEDLSTVTAIAIDCTRTLTGDKMVLDELQSVTAYVHMRAPSGAEATGYVNQDAHAYNNAYMSATMITKATGKRESNFIRKDYTKVGLAQFSIDITKAWSDDADRDGMRPDSLTIHLFRNGEDTGKTLTLNDENGWTAAFENIDYCSPTGEKYLYELVEEDVDGYIPSTTVTNEYVEGNTAEIVNNGKVVTPSYHITTPYVKAQHTHVTNTHKPATVRLYGTKTWWGGTDVRPARITLRLMADGAEVKRVTVKPSGDGSWTYDFGEWPVYRDHGTAIDYQVVEDTAGMESFRPVYAQGEDGSTDILNEYHPYGDLVITKTVRDATSVNDGREFTFTVNLFRGDEVLTADEKFTYQIDGVEMGQIASGDTIKLKDGQTARIVDVPENVTYEVTEEEVAGFVTAATNAQSIISPNQDNTAAFTNTYRASGEVALEATKLLTGRAIIKNLFRFEIVDQDGNVVASANNAAPTSTTADEDGVVTSTAKARFAALEYTQAEAGTTDAPRTYEYTIREKDLGRAGYDYSQAGEYKLFVSPYDEGDGTMTFEVRVTSGDGTTLYEAHRDGTSEGSLDGVVFNNTYTATGSYVPDVFKVLVGNADNFDDFNLEAGQFTFELAQVLTNDDGTTELRVLGTKSNDEFGAIKFDEYTAPDGQTIVTGGIPYTQKDAYHNEQVASDFDPTDVSTVLVNGTEYTYAIREFVPAGSKGTGQQLDDAETDPIEYDTHWYLFKVKVTDPGTSTLSTEATIEGVEVRCWNVDETTHEHPFECDVCGGSGTVSAPQDLAEPYIFTNTERPGSLSITKTIADDPASQSHRDQIFTFRVELVGESGTAPGVPVTPGSDETGDDDSTGGSGSQGTTPSATIQSASDADESAVRYVEPTYTVGPRSGTIDGTESGTPWTYDGRGNLLIGPGEVTMGSGRRLIGSSEQATGVYDEVKNVSFAPGTRLNFANSGKNDTQTLSRSQLPNLHTVDFTNLNADSVGNFEGLLSHSNVVRVKDSGKLIDSSAHSRVFSINGFFYKADRLVSIDCPNWDLQKASSLYFFCDGCKNLQYVSSANWQIRDNRDLEYAFRECMSLTSIDMSTWDTRCNNTSSAFQVYAFPASIARITVGKTTFALGSSSGYTGNASSIGLRTDARWMREGGKEGGYSVAEMITDACSMPEGATYTYILDLSGTVSYSVNGGVSAAPVTVDVENFGDFAFTLPAGALIRPNYKFVGWNTAQDGSGVHFEPGAEVNANQFISFIRNGNVTLYAEWQSRTPGASQLSEGVYEVDVKGGTTERLPVDIPAGTAYRVYEQTPAGWVLVQATDDSGVIKPITESNAAFTNRYDPTATSATISALKLMAGQPAAAGSDFTFVLKEDGQEIQRVNTVGEGGSVAFSSLEYRSAGTHTYTIEEIPGSDSSIEYDSHTETVTVEVADAGRGLLIAAVTYDDDGAVFSNDYKPGSEPVPETGAITITKAVDGTDALNVEFEFTLKLNGRPYVGDYTVGDETRTTADGKIVLLADQTATISGVELGKAYTVEETGSLGRGWTKGAGEGTTGRVAAAQTYAVSFTNTYSPDPVTFAPAASKLLLGRALEDGEFAFDLYQIERAEDGSETRTLVPGSQGVTNSAPDLTGVGEVHFGSIEYTKPGTYVYEVQEREGNEPGVVYNTDPVRFEVVVTDGVEENGTLRYQGRLFATQAPVQNEGHDDVTTPLVVNSLEEHTLSIGKVVANPEFAEQKTDKAFTVRVGLAASDGLALANVAVLDADGNQTGTVSDGGTITLGQDEVVRLVLPYGATWTLEEVDLPSGWTCESVTNGTGTMGTDDAEATVTNRYQATGDAQIEVTKTVDGKAPVKVAADGSAETMEFTFQLFELTGEYDDDANWLKSGTTTETMVATAKNDASGRVAFGLDYTFEETGTHYYVVREQNDGTPGLAFDSKEIKVVVRVTDNGDGTLSTEVDYGGVTQPGFSNLSATQLARTGGAGVSALGLVVLGAGIFGWARSRRKEEN